MQAILSVAGRVLLCGIFLSSAVMNKVPKFSEVVGYMEGKGVPYPNFLLPGAIVFLIVGSLSVIVGYRARFGALLLAIFLVPTTYYFHAFWKLDPADTTLPGEMAQFMKNVALFGAMLFVVANGSGAGSLDERRGAGTTP